jgi:hypothetical protein
MAPKVICYQLQRRELKSKSKIGSPSLTLIELSVSLLAPKVRKFSKGSNGVRSPKVSPLGDVDISPQPLKTV